MKSTRSQETTTMQPGESGREQKFLWAWPFSIIGSLLLAVGFYWYVRTQTDLAPDSILGLVYAAIGSVFFFWTLLYYIISRYQRHRQLGKLFRLLQWHMSFGIITCVSIFFHSFGNFNLRTGTYALFSMLALFLSGLLGKLLDRILPIWITRAAARGLTREGEDYLDVLSRNFQRQQVLRTLRGAISLTPVPLTQERFELIQRVESAFFWEQVYRYSIRYWRLFHRLLSIVTLGLIIWHILYALSLYLHG